MNTLQLDIIQTKSGHIKGSFCSAITFPQNYPKIPVHFILLE